MVDHLFSDPDLAALYDAWGSGDQRRDYDFYLPFVLSAKSVLDVGCGTGALLHAAREYGHQGRLCGLDPAAAMLAQAQKRDDIEWVLGDHHAIAWQHEFDLTLMTGHAFQALTGDDEIRALLAAIRLALTREGRFAFETRNPPARAWENWTPANAVDVIDVQGASVHIATQVEQPFDGSLVSFSHTFSSPTWTRPKISRSTLRFLDVNLLAHFLGEAGLAIEEQFGDWDRRPLSDAGPEIITIARVR